METWKNACIKTLDGEKKKKNIIILFISFKYPK